MLPASQTLKQKTTAFRPPLDKALLFATAENGETSMLAVMLDNYPEALNLQDEAGQTLLHVAASWAKTEMVDMLLARGADTTIRDPQRQSAADLAARLGYETIAQMMTMEDGQRAAEALQQKLQQERLVCTRGLPQAITARPAPVRFKNA